MKTCINYMTFIVSIDIILYMRAMRYNKYYTTITIHECMLISIELMISDHND